jgi:sarcosine oxidase
MFDVIVLGLGAMGSAATYHLSRRGKRVLGLEQFTPVHEKGSSHGSSRMIRQAYFEHPAYVPLLRRAYELWERLERDRNTKLLRLTGGLMIGSPDSEVVKGSIQSARDNELPYAVLDAQEVRRRFPALNPAPSEIAVHESCAGYLRPEDCIRAHLAEAARCGATLHFEESVVNCVVDRPDEPILLTTGRGSYKSERLIIAAGAWAPHLLGDLGLPLVVTRQVMYWFEPLGGISQFFPDQFPVFVWDGRARWPFYGFPAIDGSSQGVKVAIHGSGHVCTPNTIDRKIHQEDVEGIRECIAARIPTLNGPLLAAKTCMYTMTPDGHPVIGLHPQHPGIVMAAGFSGHGFKFSSTVGEILADLATKGDTLHRIDLFSPDRFRVASR